MCTRVCVCVCVYCRMLVCLDGMECACVRGCVSVRQLCLMLVPLVSLISRRDVPGASPSGLAFGWVVMNLLGHGWMEPCQHCDDLLRGNRFGDAIRPRTATVSRFVGHSFPCSPIPVPSCPVPAPPSPFCPFGPCPVLPVCPFSRSCRSANLQPCSTVH